MAQLNITLNQEEILQLLSTDHDQAFSPMNVQRSEPTAETEPANEISRPGSGGSPSQFRDIGTFLSRRSYLKTIPAARRL